MRLRIKGLTQFQLKVVACIAMTIDHIPKILLSLSFSQSFAILASAIGRISAPLFLFCFIESLHKTHDRKHFILRIYLSNIFISLFIAMMNFLFNEWIGVYDFGQSILSTFFYVGLYSYAINNVINLFRKKERARAIFEISSIVFLPFFLSWMAQAVFSNGWEYLEGIFKLIGVQDAYINIININMQIVLTSVFPSPLNVEYTMIFVILGVMSYFLPTYHRIIVFSLFCMFSYVGSHLMLLSIYPFTDFFAVDQWKMVYAIPFMLIYNKQKGKSFKLFFYMYYPLHRYSLIIIDTLFALTA
ncbi:MULTISPECIES: TraX family protein [Agathobaculum]|uniref:TraX family protein n=1 Tax=Agathobaculum TaxID=2048137 RepID=UPI003F8F7841